LIIITQLEAGFQTNWSFCVIFFYQTVIYILPPLCGILCNTVGDEHKVRTLNFMERST